MKTIKIIDLLNKIANGEVLPIRFKYREYEYFLNDVNDYWCVDTRGWFSTEELSTTNLNDELEIIEILDEEDEFEDIYSLCDNSEQYNFSSRQTEMTKEDRRLLDSNFKELLIVVNQLIENQKKIMERLKEE